MPSACASLASIPTSISAVPFRALHSLDYTGTAILENDVVGAWAAATEGEAGIVVIPGTGSKGFWA